MVTIEFNETVTISSPTLEQYDLLYAHHAQTLTCPCQHISLDRADLISIDYRLHQICSSDFVSEEWLSYLYEIYEWWREYFYNGVSLRAPVPRDFRSLSPFMFQALSALCTLSNTTIETGLMQFYNSKYISFNLIARLPFESQVLLLLNNFKTATAKKLLSSMSIIGDVIQINNVLPAVDSNIDFVAGLFGYVVITHRIFNGCNCLEKRTCVIPSTIDNTAYNGSIYYIPNFYYGCYALYSLLQSSLTCFYDQVCFDGLILHLERELISSINIMNVSAPSRFAIDTPIQELLDEIMVEEWNRTSPYERYFNACHPIECHYMYPLRRDAVQIVSTIFGLTGGLISVLRFIVPSFTHLMLYLTKQRRRTDQRKIIPENRQSNITASDRENIRAI